MKRWMKAAVVVGLVMVVAVLAVMQARRSAAMRGGPLPTLLSSDQTPQWVARRVQAWLPTDLERSWEKIAWTEGLHNALEKAQQLNRPIMLFSYAGCVEGRL